MNGYELSEYFRERYPRALNIAISGYVRAEAHERSRQAGFDFHLVKPVQREELSAILAQADRYRPKS